MPLKDIALGWWNLNWVLPMVRTGFAKRFCFIFTLSPSNDKPCNNILTVLFFTYLSLHFLFHEVENVLHSLRHTKKF